MFIAVLASPADTPSGQKGGGGKGGGGKGGGAKSTGRGGADSVGTGYNATALSQSK
jgi:hypothetical protein